MSDEFKPLSEEEVEEGLQLGTFAAIRFEDFRRALRTLQQEREKAEKMRAALVWLLHLHSGVSKGGDEYSPPSDAEWRDALHSAEEAIK